MKDSKLVYATGKGSQRKDQKTTSYQASKGPTKMRLESKGRGGKVVTVLWNFPFSEDEVKSLMKELQAQAACGASFKEQRLEFQGDIKDKAKKYFESKKWPLQLAGA